MADQEFDAETYARQTAALLGIPLSSAQLPGVVLNLERAAELAALLADFPLSEAEDEPAPVFRP